MKKARTLLLLSLAFSFLHAEETPMVDAKAAVPPPPVVTALSAEVSDDKVLLSWIPAQNVTGESLILRADRPITAANYQAASVVGTVSSDATSFTDKLPDANGYYYAVISRDSAGNAYNFFLPASNSLLVAVSSGQLPQIGDIAAITGLDVVRKDDSVFISWSASIKRQNLVLYRSTTPFTSLTSLLQAIVIASFTDSGTPYIDYPVPGVAWYYAICDEDALRGGAVTFTAGANASRIPIEIPAGSTNNRRYILPVLRPMPLPWLNPSNEAPRPMATFSPQVEKIVHRLISEAEPARVPADRAAYIFASDLDPRLGGEDYTLRKILEKTLNTGRWEQTIQELNGFLAIRHSPETAARAHFYIGEALYFSKAYTKAIPEFLLAQDSYYNQAREWIGYSLDKLVY